jgi:hypothetical protein
MGTQTRFDWLRNTHLRRSGLRDVEAAVRAGRLDGPEHADRRAELVAALVVLARDPDLRPRESIRVSRIFASFAEHDQQQEKAGVRDQLSQEQPRPSARPCPVG